jgi:hypothetical protein
MENKPSAMVVSLGYGVIISLAIVVLSLILFLLNLDQGTGLEYLPYLLLIAGIWLAQYNYRNKYLGGFITYGQAFTIGMWISLFVAIVMGIYTFVFFNYINPGAMEEAMVIAEQRMMDKGMTDLEIEQGMMMARKFSGVGMFTTVAVISNFFAGLIISLVTAIFVKKEEAGFNQPTV